MHIWVSELDNQLLVGVMVFACSPQRHDLNHCWLIINWRFGDYLSVIVPIQYFSFTKMHSGHTVLKQRGTIYALSCYIKQFHDKNDKPRVNLCHSATLIETINRYLTWVVDRNLRVGFSTWSYMINIISQLSYMVSRNVFVTQVILDADNKFILAGPTSCIRECG